ncbi:MAG: peptide chain release factor 2 [Candidatus Yanofskybacteria bacterium RIFCSPLOWO2_01_FULL_49_25]|uniref:Peptide chain release factor 2 n=1 Tax=Candidatus Yanofskybacteria bacterium RIFCSPLOWO2_01_FULL_49_25 TaxID=1802701 RepID=A0A1F8GT94_9BACT|nr:MAG: peptide chain release factor 2 [Candidatus Yanofskybacteria bacterium RIFCSPLOWO2_01_FULL_49_25]
MICKRSSRQSGSVFDLDGIEERIADLELEMQAPDFWKDHITAGKRSKELTDLKEDAEFWEHYEVRLGEFTILDDSGLASREADVRELKKQFDKQYIRIFLSAPYDKGSALVSIHSGAGGIDAQDWASMLLRMYQRYCERVGYAMTILHKTEGEQNGIKNATVEVSGRYAYGRLKGESGVHRLVRVSPFDANARRHTSFALVEILPEIEETTFTINPTDLRVDTFRSSGPGGQNVNKLETAVRVTHIPTNIAVAVQSERSQAQNKEKAMQVLHSRLAALMEEKKVKELSELRGDIKDQSIEWGNQIRSYVVNPYKQVKDHRTGVESTQPERILEGELDEFIEAEVIAIKP